MTDNPSFAGYHDRSPEGMQPGFGRPNARAPDHDFPRAITDHRRSGELELVWQDLTTARLPHRLLRSRCRCGGCEQQRRHAGRPDDVPPDIRLDDIRLVGDKGLNLVFNDGHGRGIYPWAYLREIAQEASEQQELPVSPAITGEAHALHA